MPATRAAQQRAEAQRIALLAAASNADSQPLGLELVEIVIQHLPRSQLARARLVSKQFAAAVDPLISAVCISLTNKDKRATQLVGLQHVTRLSVGSEVKGSDQWRQLQHITSQLPKLNTPGPLGYPTWGTCILGVFKSSLSSLSSLTRLDLETGDCCADARDPVPKGVQLPGLRAASFSKCRNLADIVAFAPNLEHMFCHYLEVGDDRPAALPTCTHFGSYDLRITSNAEAAQAFAAAFPNLQVVAHMPQVFHRQPIQLLSAQQLLAQSASVYAVRGDACRLRMDAAAPALQVQRLCLHGYRLSALEISSINSMSQLQHLCTTFVVADGTAQALLHALAALPQLQSLVLPAGVLCSQCCPGVQSSLAALTAKSSLKQLVFLERRHLHKGVLATGLLRCTHPEAIQAGLQSIAAAAAAAARTQEQQQQQQLTITHKQQHQYVMPNTVLANPASAAGVWGVYGPPGEW